MKAVVLKPIVWNSDDYVKPSGHKARSGFAFDFGYGHEEWNNSNKNIWRDQRVFHTEGTEALVEFSSNAKLGLIPIASFKGNQYALGIATSVTNNSHEDMGLISEELSLFDREQDVWLLDRVKTCFKDKKAFDKHWKENYQWIKWRCPKDQYTWFDKPVLLNPKEISGKNKLTSMHGKHQAITSATALGIVNDYLPNDHASLEWLVNGEFDDGILNRVPSKSKISSQRLRKKYGIKGGNSSPSAAYEYWVKGKRSVNPYHSILQGKFAKFLEDSGIKPTEDKNYIDVQYKQKKRLVYAEIKPTENIETKYAIRTAIGQLLEYQFRFNKDACLEIVIGSKPSLDEIKFVNSLGFTLTFFHDEKFTRCLPKT